LVGNNRPHLRT